MQLNNRQRKMLLLITPLEMMKKYMLALAA